jgi:hypothetical protein
MPDAGCRMQVGCRILGGTGGLSTRVSLTDRRRTCIVSEENVRPSRQGITRKTCDIQTMYGWKRGRFEHGWTSHPCHPEKAMCMETFDGMPGQSHRMPDAGLLRGSTVHGVDRRSRVESGRN